MWKWHIPVFVFLSTLAAALALLLIITTYTITDAFIAYVNSHRAGDKARQNELALKAAATTPDALKKPTGEKSVGCLHHQVERVLRLGSASFARGSPREKKTLDLLVSVSLSGFCESKGTESLMEGRRVSLILGFFIGYNRFVFFFFFFFFFFFRWCPAQYIQKLWGVVCVRSSSVADTLLGGGLSASSSRKRMLRSMEPRRHPKGTQMNEKQPQTDNRSPQHSCELQLCNIYNSHIHSAVKQCSWMKARTQTLCRFDSLRAPPSRCFCSRWAPCGSQPGGDGDRRRRMFELDREITLHRLKLKSISISIS